MLIKNLKKSNPSEEKDNSDIDSKEAIEENNRPKIFEITKVRRSFKCPMCGKKFRENGNLKTHLRLHTGHRPYKCKYSDCTKSFATLGNLKSHEFNHCNNKPFKCPFAGCNNQYSRECRLDIHMRTHVGIKPFICPFEGCGKGFNEKGNLKTHIRIHTGEKPFVCSHPGCGIAFKALGHLKDHQKRHSSTKPFSCPICKNSFIRKSTLKIHLNTHGPISQQLLGSITREKDKEYSNKLKSDVPAFNDHKNNQEKFGSTNKLNNNFPKKNSNDNFNKNNNSSLFENDGNLINEFLYSKKFSSNSIEVPNERKDVDLLGVKNPRVTMKNRSVNRVLSLANNIKKSEILNKNLSGNSIPEEEDIGKFSSNNLNDTKNPADGKKGDFYLVNNSAKANLNSNINISINRNNSLNNPKNNFTNVNNNNNSNSNNISFNNRSQDALTFKKSEGSSLDSRSELEKQLFKSDSVSAAKLRIITKDSIIIPEAKLANQINLNLNSDENKPKEKDLENFLKPNSTSTNINYNLNNLNNQLFLQNTLLANNLNANYNNILAGNSINNVAYLSNNPQSKAAKNYLNLNSIQNNFANIAAANGSNFPGANYYAYGTAAANNMNNLATLQKPSYLAAPNNLCGQINFNNLASHNLNNNLMLNNGNNLVGNLGMNSSNNFNNPQHKKETIDFSDLQSIKNLKNQIGHEHETPGTGTGRDLNTISSLHSNIRDLNTLESKRKSNVSFSPFFRNNPANAAKFPASDSLSVFSNQANIITNNNLGEFESPNDRINNTQFNNIPGASDNNTNINNNKNVSGEKSIFNNQANLCQNLLANDQAKNPVNTDSVNNSKNNSNNNQHYYISNDNGCKNINRDYNVNVNNENNRAIKNEENVFDKLIALKNKNQIQKDDDVLDTKRTKLSSEFINFKNANSSTSNFLNLESNSASEIFDCISKNNNNNVYTNNYQSQKGYYDCSTPINNNSANLNQIKVNNNNSSNSNMNSNANKKSNFTLYSKVNNINNYNSINIKINNINNNSGSTPINSGNNFSKMANKFQNFQDFISSINNHFTANTANIASTPSSNNSNTNHNITLKNENLNNSKTSQEIINEGLEQDKTPINIGSNNVSNNLIYSNCTSNMISPLNIINSSNNNRFQMIGFPSNKYVIASATNNSNISNLTVQDMLVKNNFKENFDNLENCLYSYFIRYYQTKDKSVKYSGNYEVLGLFSHESVQNFMDRIGFYLRENPILLKGVCEKYNYLYLDSDVELKYVLLKKILNDLERIQAQTLQTINWNLINNINSGSKGSRQSSIEDFETNKQATIFNYGFKDMAEKYYSNIQKTNIPGIFSRNSSMNALMQHQNFNSLNSNNLGMNVGNNEFGTPKNCFNVNINLENNEQDYNNIFENRKSDPLSGFICPEISPNNMVNNFLNLSNLSNINSPNNMTNMDFYKNT